MTETDLIQQLAARLQETIDENDKLREENARLRSEKSDALSFLKEVYNDPSVSPALRVKSAGLCLPHEVPRLMPEPRPLDLIAEPSLPLAELVHKQRARMNQMHRAPQDIEVLPSGTVRILPKPGSNGSGDDDNFG